LLQIPNLTTILILTSTHPHLLHHPGIPHIQFPPYTRAETLSILFKTPLSIHDTPPFSQAGNAQIATNSEDSKWLWTRFTAAVWDSLGQSAARDIVSFREVCSRLWVPFTQPILGGHYGAREFSKLMVRNKGLFQSEAALADSIVPVAPTAPNDKAIKRKLRSSYHLEPLLLTRCTYSTSPHPSLLPLLPPYLRLPSLPQPS